MALKKSERSHPSGNHVTSCAGGMDASHVQKTKDAPVLLFVKYVSDKYAGNPNALIDVPAGGSFADMVALKNDKEIGDKINKLVARWPMPMTPRVPSTWPTLTTKKSWAR